MNFHSPTLRTCAFACLGLLAGCDETSSETTSSEMLLSDGGLAVTEAGTSTDSAMPPRPDSGLSSSDDEVFSGETEGSQSFLLEGWADNWYAAYLEETLIVEDPISITTERSFNKTVATFDADYPLQLNFIMKDYKENDTGLEYIGTDRQQMGDGGFIMQITDESTGEVVAVSDASMRCMVIHRAPLDVTCAAEANATAGTAPCEFFAVDEPDGWKAADYDDSGWDAAVVHGADDVGPKDGYNEIVWDDAAELVWGDDLKTDNTILCRLTVEAP